MLTSGHWTLLAVVGSYLVIVVFVYRIPWGGALNYDRAGSLADWTAALGTAGALLFGVSRYAAEQELGRRADAESVFGTIQLSTIDDPIRGALTAASVELLHLGTRPIVVQSLLLRAGPNSLDLALPPGPVPPTSIRQLEPIEVELGPANDWSGATVCFEFTDAWGVSWRRDSTQQLTRSS
ncbi:MAG: hypothetical protein AAGD18_01860 [Actinomycetota bacterium]